MTEPKIITPQEAEGLLSLAQREQIYQPNLTVARLAHTVATEPVRTRAAVVKALLHFADAYGDVDAAEIAQNVKNGADW